MRFRRLLHATALLLAASVAFTASAARSGDGGMTGEVLTLLYVTDVHQSVEFYKAIGFRHYYYYDYEEDEYVLDWSKPYPSGYAEMTNGTIRLALTTAEDEEAVYGGGVRHYFIVDEVEERYKRLKSRGVLATPDEVEKRPWMDFITLSDPDGHQIVLGKKNQPYYDDNQAKVDRLHEPTN